MPSSPTAKSPTITQVASPVSEAKSPISKFPKSPSSSDPSSSSYVKFQQKGQSKFDHKIMTSTALKKGSSIPVKSNNSKSVPIDKKRRPTQSNKSHDAPMDLQPDDLKKLLQEFKKKWQQEYGQRVRFQESNRLLRDQLSKFQVRISKLEGPQQETVSIPQSPVPNDSSVTKEGGSDTLKSLIKKGVDANAERFAKLEDQLKRAAGRLKEYETGKKSVITEEESLRQSNMIAVLTKRNKELTKEKRKLEHLLHAKSLQLEAEAKKSQKIISETEAMKAKIARDKTAKELELTEALKKKLALEEKIREYEKRIDEEAKIRVTLEHQNYTLRQKVEKVNFNEALGTFLDAPDSSISQSDKTKGQPAAIKIDTGKHVVGSENVPDDKNSLLATSTTKKPRPIIPNLSIPSPDEDKKIKVARVTLEYDAWVASKKIDNKPKDKDVPQKPSTDEQPLKMEGSPPAHHPSTKPDDLAAHTHAASDSDSVPTSHKNTNPSAVRSPSPVGIDTYSQKHDEFNNFNTNGSEEAPKKLIISESPHPDEAVSNRVQ